jgi:hypothetical protein
VGGWHRYWACIALTPASNVGQIRGAAGERWIVGMVRYEWSLCPSEKAMIFFIWLYASGLRNPHFWGDRMHGLMICVDAR